MKTNFVKRVVSFSLVIFLSASFFSSFIFAEPKNAEGPLPSGPKPKDRPSVALVLAGGGAKGFAHLPIIEMIEEVGIPIDMVIGTSIGSIIGGLYSAGYSTSEILAGFDRVNWGTTFIDNARSPYEDTLGEYSLNRNIAAVNFGKDFSLRLGRGISNGQGVYQLLKNMTLKYPSNQDFNKLNIPFRAVVTDLLSGEALVLDEGDLAEAIRASMSLPSIFEPAEFDGHYYIDGGVRYNLAINVAKNMGYDIIIAVDISARLKDNADSYSSNPSVALLSTITIAQYNVIQGLYKDATLVITPDISGYGTLDFKKAKAIYNEGKKVRDENFPKLEEVRKQIYPNDYDAQGKRISERGKAKERGVYRKRANLIPTELKIEGAVKQDERLIRNAFEDIYDEELTQKNFEYFMDRIYLTGNYISVRPRVYDTEDGTIIDLQLTQKDKHENKVVVGIDFEQTIAPTSLTSLNFDLQLQFRGFTGPGSVFALSTTSVNDFGAEFYYLQPFNAYFFMDSEVFYKDSRYAQMPISLADYGMFNTEFHTYRDMEAVLYFGARTDNGNLIRLGGYYHYRKTSNFSQLFDEYTYYIFEYSDTLYDDGEPIVENWDPIYLDQYYIGKTSYKNGVSAKTFGAILEYEFDRLDRDGFAHRGFYMLGVADLQYAYRDTKIYDPALCLSLDMKAAIPLGRYFSINTSLFAGSDVLGNVKNVIPLKLAAGFSRYDRIFFPQYTTEYFGANKLAIELALQIEPWDQITLFGGNLFFRINGTFGNVFDTWDQFIPLTTKNMHLAPLIWTASVGTGVRIKNGYSIYLRLGASSNQKIGFSYYDDEDGTTPIFFMALDIGSICF